MRISRVEVRPKDPLRSGTWVVDVSVHIESSEPDMAVASVCRAIRGNRQEEERQ